jgi:hypothetical protein
VRVGPSWSEAKVRQVDRPPEPVVPPSAVGSADDPVRDLVFSLALDEVDLSDRAIDALGAPGAQAVVGAVLGLMVTDRFGVTRDVDAIADLVRELRTAMPDPADFKPMIAEAVIRVILGEADLRRHISDEDFVFAAIDLSRGLLHQQQLTGDALEAFVGRVEEVLRQAEIHKRAGEAPGTPGDDASG